MVAHKTNALRRWIVGLVIVSTLLLAGNAFFLVDRWQRNIVVSVPDGDSLQLKDGRRIRLLGIDAPERGRCMAGEAREKLVELAQGKHVRLTSTVTDDYGRTLAIVTVEDIGTWLEYLQWKFLGSRPGLERGVYPEPDPLLQRALLAAGLARNESGISNPYHQVLKDAERLAKSAKLGIWSDACRGKTSGKEDCTIKGNTRAGKKYYYTPDCASYDQVLVDTAFGDQWFCTEGEAGKAGFIPATSCDSH